MAKTFRQGVFEPKHPEKYVGNVDNIVYRSSWELKFNQFCDNNPNILRWASEEIKIPYIKPTDNRVHHYYPDYWIEYKNKSGQVVREIIEVKPSTQTRAPRRKKARQQLYEQLTYAINIAKWTYAKKWCEERGIKFRIVTEKELFR